MRILITNDDGINATGLKVMHDIAAEIAGPEGEVWTVAPAFEQSGVAHCISYTHPTMIAELGPRRFAAEGSPADCVMAGLYDVMKDAAPDLILSGVNRGNNSGENAMYSGTLGGALEGALQGHKAIALSQYYGPEIARSDDPFEAARVHGAQVIRTLLVDGDWSASPYRTFYNVNFPPFRAADVKGTRVVPQGARENARFSVEAQLSPAGRRFLWVKGSPQHLPANPGTDVAVNMDGFISVTPMRADLTAHELVTPLQAAFE
ncbi:MAG: 5'/3'-nucleotidase SurE [Dinoroseobacter sp.]|nr:5'/3'-nucleotidase SurE [Dinoroseobacter sp.]